LALALAASGYAREPRYEAARIVAVGDVHGDYGQFTGVLRHAGLIDEDGDWSGGSAHLVQTGDIPDRGPDTRRIIDLMTKLEKQARRAKGRVHALIGNHEAMNITGDLRYVHPGEYAAFVTKRSEALRDAYYNAYIQAVAAQAAEDGAIPPVFDDAYRASWNARFPLGYVEHRQAWEPTGKIAKWVIKHDTAVIVGNALFVHGGISHQFVGADLETLNDAVAAELKQGPPRNGGIVENEFGPLWYRGHALNPEASECPHVERVLAQFGVAHIVVGHTPTGGAIRPRCGGKVIQIDVGLAAHYGGHMAYLEIVDGQPFAVNGSARVALPPGDGPALLEYLGRFGLPRPVVADEEQDGHAEQQQDEN